eukprot:s1603_g3.t2
MRQAGTKTNEITFNSAISTCRSWRHAQAMLMSMVDQRIPDQIGFNACLSTYAAAGLWALSLQLLNTMSCCRFAPDVFSRSSVISACRDEWYVAIDALDDAGLASIV